jgi:RES domain-containing protein
MTMRLWRIAAETRRYAADDLSGAGAAKYPGRWNDAGQAVVYAAETIALAVLETAAHIDDAGLPLNRFVVAIDVPDEIWSARETLVVKALPPNWEAIPAGSATVRIGSAWLTEARSAMLVAPSVIVPEESICLVNPAHPDAEGVRATAIRLFHYARLFRPA